MARAKQYPLTVTLRGLRPPDKEDLDLLVDGMSHLTPEVLEERGAEVDLRVSVLAFSADEARDYMDRQLQSRRRDWLGSWAYGGPSAASG